MPLLSICIPTYNRARLLGCSLKSITACDSFRNTDDVEVIISDNCSTDNTREVVDPFLKEYGSKIKYCCSSENIHEKNFERVLSLGTGEFLKLQNDSLCLLPNALDGVLHFIRQHKKEQPLLFFLNGNGGRKDSATVCKDVNEFVAYVSFYSTWIGGFGLWKKDFAEIVDFGLYVKKRLPQTDVLFRLLKKKKESVVYNPEIFRSQKVFDKGGYNIAEVFGCNYVKILKDMYCNQVISRKTYQAEKKRVLLKHVIRHYFDFEGKYNFDRGRYWFFTDEYHTNVYYYLAYVKIFLKKLVYMISESSCFRARKRKRRWKKINKKNYVKLLDYKRISTRDIQKISIGENSYGVVNPMFWGAPNEEIIIGSYVSMAFATFLCGGGHAYKGFSTYPFKVRFLGEKCEALSKGAIVIEDDVWIGYGVTILSGVTVGQGAIIAAGSLVAKDVEPYSIVGGNPARFIKYRFDEIVRKKMMAFSFKGFTSTDIVRAKDVLYTPLTSENVDDVLSKLRCRG